MSGRIPPPNVPVVGSDGIINPDWYRYFVSLARSADGAAAGEVLGEDGLDGGGAVSGGVTLGIADNGVSDAKLRQGLPTSVIGRFLNSTGDVADIQAVADERVLARIDGMLVFTANPSVEQLRCDTLRIDAVPAVAAAVASTHKLAFSANGTTYYLLLSNV